MKLFLVYEGEYEDRFVEAVFLSREEAGDYVSNHSGLVGQTYIHPDGTSHVRMEDSKMIYEVMEIEVAGHCTCVDFKKAQEERTDNEGYEALIGYREKDGDLGIVKGWNIGDHLPAMKYCPWCGKPVPEDQP